MVRPSLEGRFLTCHTYAMQKLATNIFIVASLAFGVVGVVTVLAGGPDKNEFLGRLLMLTVFIILPSFALSVAGKYLNGKS